MATPHFTRGKVLVTALGAPISALLSGAALFRGLPLAAPWALAISAHIILPLWVTLVCVLPLLKTVKSAWAACAIIPISLRLFAWFLHGLF